MQLSVQSINRDAYEPVYIQLANLFKEEIVAGNLRPGDQLPTESQLCNQFEVSPMTVRRAVNALLEQGLVTTARGRGTFVRPMELGSATFGINTLMDFFRDEERTVIRILEARIVPADERISRKLSLPPDTRTIFIRRLLSYDGQPAFYHREYLVYDPARPIVEAEMEVTTLQGLFGDERAGGMKGGSMDIEAANLNREEAQILALEEGRAAFRFEHIFYDFDDRIVSWGWFLCRGDLLHFTARVGA
jgi:GntR family transcriptional regulator